MKAGDLRRLLSEVMSIPEGTVRLAQRNLREFGLLTTGAHGVNAPDMAYLDGSRGVASFLAYESPGRRAPEVVQNFGQLPWSNRAMVWEDDQFSLESLCPTSSLDVFEDALTALIRIFAEHREHDAFVRNSHRSPDGTIAPPRCIVTLSLDHRYAEIRMEDRHYSFMDMTNVGDPRTAKNEHNGLGVQRVAWINSAVLMRLGDAFAETTDTTEDEEQS